MILSISKVSFECTVPSITIQLEDHIRFFRLEIIKLVMNTLQWASNFPNGVAANEFDKEIPWINETNILRNG